MSVSSSAIGQRDPRAEEGPISPRKQPALDLGQPELRLRRGDDHVAPEEQLEAAGERRGVRGADHRDDDLALHQTLEGVHHVAVDGTLLAAGEAAQVHTRAESPVAGAGEDEGPDLRVRLGLFDRLREAGHHGGVERVARLGPIQASDEDVAAPLAYDLIAHGRNSSASWCPRSTV